MTLVNLNENLEEFKIFKPIRLIELFGGISCQAQALLNLGVNFENYRYCDFDKYACQSHNEIMGTNDKPSDITKWKGEDLGICDKDKYCYIMTYSFPCTDLSVAGKMNGMEKGSGTRSGLLWEVERLLEESPELPQVLLMENVPQVHLNPNKNSFYRWMVFLEGLGYKNYWKDLNAKDYGVPQNRNRCFMISLLGNYYYKFPKPIELKLKLSELLENDVDEKYYLNDKLLNGTLTTNYKCEKLENMLPRERIVPTLCARDYKDPKLILVGNLQCKGFECNKRVYSVEGLCPCLTTAGGGNTEIKIKDLSGNIRKLTPTEYLRLMGVREQYIKKMSCSNNKKYQQAGNGIVVDVLMEIFKKLIGDKIND